MITAAAILRGDRERLLAFDPEEHPVALQLGGSDPETWPRPRKRRGGRLRRDQPQLRLPQRPCCEWAFGACLMLEPARWRIAWLRWSAVKIPVTVKMRVGVISARAQDCARGRRQTSVKLTSKPSTGLSRAIEEAGCQVAIVHARKAVLGGLSPKDNREVPPLRYDVVKQTQAGFSVLCR